MLPDVLQARLLQVCDAFPQTDHGRNVQIARFVFVRQGIGLAVLVTLSTCATLPQGKQFTLITWRNVQDTQPGGTQQSLVGRRGQELSTHLPDIDWHMPQRLRRIHHVGHTMLSGDPPHLRHRLQCAGDIRSMDQRY